MPHNSYPVTPDGRYFIVKDRLWRCTNPEIPEDERVALVKELMSARLAIKHAKFKVEIESARKRVHDAKVKLGERDPVWWDDGSEDVNRHHPKNTKYADWWSSQSKKAIKS